MERTPLLDEEGTLGLGGDNSKEDAFQRSLTEEFTRAHMPMLLGANVQVFHKGTTIYDHSFGTHSKDALYNLYVCSTTMLLPGMSGRAVCGCECGWVRVSAGARLTGSDWRTL